MSNSIEQYRELRTEVDRRAADIERMRSADIHCEKGCHECCLNLSVWPVEFYSILEELRQAEWEKPEFNTAAACGYLCDGKCIIYPYRPIICRTHGLPLVYWYDELEPPGYGVMFCRRNFTDEAGRAFTADNTLNMEEINSRLARINLQFLEELGDGSLTPETRIELKELLNYL